MFDKLDTAISMLSENNFAMLQPAAMEQWDSLVINRRKPYTYRAFKLFQDGPLAGHRVCLHRFEPCEASEAFLHPHPWPSAMVILSGTYRMRIGASVDKASQPVIVLDEMLARGSRYSMTEPLGWHAVQPMTTCWSIMVNGQPWDAQTAHQKAPTTKGKDLDKLSASDLAVHLDTIRVWLRETLA